MPTSPASRIFLISVLILMLELAVIRWFQTEVVIFAYLSNMVLIAVFLGIGAGCYAAERRTEPVATAGCLALLVFLVLNPLHLPSLSLRSISVDVADISNILMFFKVVIEQPNWLHVMRGLLLASIALLLLAALFFPLGQVLGAALDLHGQAIRAYSINILGSLAGVWLFNLASFLWLPPPIWFLTCLPLLLPFLLPGWRRVLGSAALLSCVALTAMPSPGAVETIWSPYQRLDLSQEGQFHGTHIFRGIFTNHVGYQTMVNLSDNWAKQHPDQHDPLEVWSYRYNVPFLLSHIEDVLVVGAGSGNNAAAALRAGARHITAVDIDPAIVALGRRYHPERPYDDARVTVEIDDARSFFRRSHQKFDLVWFGYLDSHIQSSAMNNMRLDNYVYTRESLQDAYRLLKPDGILVCSFAYEGVWLQTRIGEILNDAFHAPPIVYSHVFLASQDQRLGTHFVEAATEPARQAVLERFRSNPKLQALHAIEYRWRQPVTPTTDDWPYLYLPVPTLPGEHVAVSLIIVALLVVFRCTGFPSGQRIQWEFFFLGAGFLLLEVHAIDRCMLLFGSTWIVNSAVITMVLLLIYAGNLWAQHLGTANLPKIYVGLLASLILLLLVPISFFQHMPGALRHTLGPLFLCLPILFAAVIFAQAFANTKVRSTALGSNLIGAIAGGLLGILSFIVGMQAISGLALTLYVLALLSRR